MMKGFFSSNSGCLCAASFPLLADAIQPRTWQREWDNGARRERTRVSKRSAFARSAAIDQGHAMTFSLKIDRRRNADHAGAHYGNVPRSCHVPQSTLMLPDRKKFPPHFVGCAALQRAAH